MNYESYESLTPLLFRFFVKPEKVGGWTLVDGQDNRSQDKPVDIEV
jgi:hypothetical protein